MCEEEMEVGRCAVPGCAAGVGVTPSRISGAVNILPLLAMNFPGLQGCCFSIGCGSVSGASFLGLSQVFGDHRAYQAPPAAPADGICFSLLCPCM